MEYTGCIPHVALDDIEEELLLPGNLFARESDLGILTQEVHHFMEAELCFRYKICVTI